MLRIATSHVGNDAWVRLQAERFRRHTSEPYRAYAVLDRPVQWTGHFDWIEQTGPRHANFRATLNRLTEVVLAEAEPDDMIVFAHGDAFPIADGWNERVRAWLEERPLVAPLRSENAGDPHPHECFLATTVGFWRELGVDWNAGPRWESETGRLETDTGARVWRALVDRGIEWQPLLRSNRVDLHPLWFAIYGGIAYHHGAGFRPMKPMSRADAARYARLPAPIRRPALLARRLANIRSSRRLHRRLLAGEDVIGELG